MKPVLYAEDEVNDVFFLQRAFRDAGIQNPLVVVPNGQVALDYLSGTGIYANRTEHPFPCLALLDLRMPVKSGLEVLKWIRTQPAICALPVIMLTASPDECDIHRAYLQGANGFLNKPNQPSDLLTMVKAVRDYWLVQNRVASDTG